MRCLLPFCLTIIYAHAASNGSTVKMQVIDGRAIVDHVYLNGNGPYRFLLDTGAQSNQVDAKLASKLGLKPEYRVQMVTAAGTAPVAAGRVAKLTLGAASATGQEFLFTDLAAVRQLSAGIQGVLGQEFLANFDYLIDFQRHQLVFDSAPENGDRIPVRLLPGRIMAIYSSRGELVFDSGTQALILFNEGGTIANARLRTASGVSGTRTAEQEERLMIDGRQYSAPLVAFAGPAARQEAGLLPASLFRSVYVSNSGLYVIPQQPIAK